MRWEEIVIGRMHDRNARKRVIACRCPSGWGIDYATGTGAEDLQLIPAAQAEGVKAMIRKLKSGEYRLYSRKINPKTGRRRNLGTFKTRAEAEKHERAVQYFKRHG